MTRDDPAKLISSRRKCEMLTPTFFSAFQHALANVISDDLQRKEIIYLSLGISLLTFSLVQFSESAYKSLLC